MGVVPVEETFAYITDQGRLAEWNDHAQWAEVIDDGRVAVGSKVTALAALQGRLGAP